MINQRPPRSAQWRVGAKKTWSAKPHDGSDTDCAFDVQDNALSRWADAPQAVHACFTAEVAGGAPTVKIAIPGDRVGRPYDTWHPTGFLIHGFWAGRESWIFEVWAAPAAPQTIPEGGGRSLPPFGMVFGAAGAARTPHKSMISGRPKTMY